VSPIPLRSLQRTAVAAALFLVAAGVLQTALGFADGWPAFAPLVLSVILFGLPHGAIDHLVVLGLAGQPLRPRPLAIVVVAYLLVAVAVILCWRIAPALALVGFLTLTAFHWGRADVQFDRIVLFPGSPVSASAGAIDTALRGAVPMGLPFVAFPAETSAFTTACQRVFGAEHPIDFASLRMGVAVLIIVLWVAHLAVHFRAFRRPCASSDRRILLESVLLTTFFTLVPPITAIGWYFCWWHGLRHVLRLCRYDGPTHLTPPRLPARLRRFYLQAIPATVASIGLLALLLTALPVNEKVGLDWIAAYLVFISALTLPHILVVEWMDRRESSAPDSATSEPVPPTRTRTVRLRRNG
jgi:Brp/Blh family beta-carotene 15,15'-monooxygenase